jgi:ribosomal protein L21E
MAPDEMEMRDVVGLNTKLRKKDIPAIQQMLSFKIGDRVRVLVRKSRFDKGGNKYSRTIYTVVGRSGYNIRISDGSQRDTQKHWELIKV